MVVIVPVEKRASEHGRVFDAAEAFREIRPVFHCLEMAFGERVIVRDAGSAEGFYYPEIGVELGDEFGFHRRSAVGMDGQIAGQYELPEAGFIDELFRERGGFFVGDEPADDVSAEDVEDDVEIEIRPGDGAFEFEIGRAHV